MPAELAELVLLRGAATISRREVGIACKCCSGGGAYPLILVGKDVLAGL